jgi:hypothetical protein
MKEILFSPTNYLFDQLRKETRTPVKGHSPGMLFQKLRLRGLGGDTSLLPGKIQNERASAVECISKSTSVKDLKLCPLLPAGDLDGSQVTSIQ